VDGNVETFTARFVTKGFT